MNRLADATSPYLLQHADNPVDWYPWGEEAFARARAEDKPLLVSVGYSSCHWCHVMEHESFEDPATAALMNELFVNVKVDREERPDVDAVTMEATIGLTGSGGWPTTVFLTPEGKPFYAGTYFPPEARHGLPAFRDVLRAVATAWRERRRDVERQAAAVEEAIRRGAEIPSSREPLTSALLADAVRGIAATFDPVHGGFGRAPKFPAASTIELLLRRGGERALEMATRTLDAMAAGGMYDVVGGGFHRYAVDERWLVPHFEKMLYDNALLASAYLHGFAVTGRERYRRVVEETLEYVLRELRLPGGGLASAQDADTEGVEGLTYTWTLEEADAAGLPRELLHPFEHGRHVVRGELDPELRARLLAIRSRRPQPFRDEKALASWNGLALAALAEAGYRLEREDWLAAARELAGFLLGPLSDPAGDLYRAVRDGRPSGPGFLDDYANAAFGLLELHAATGELRWLLEARRLALRAVELFADEERGGFYLSPADGDARLPRTKDLQDTPTPSGSSMLALVLLRLARIWGEDELERRAVSVFRLVEPAARRAPGAFAWALCGLDLWLAPPREIAVIGPVTSPVARAALARFQPNAVVAVGPAEEVPLLRGKGPVEGRPAVYVCERFACRAPVTDPAELEAVA
ncbi:MAG TPA: thioredoxin domain-containing protein [Gaiellaceae bacterium]|nr:thioredoxin domain-containing protein [Gaiellaceae bacterium]